MDPSRYRRLRLIAALLGAAVAGPCLTALTAERAQAASADSLAVTITPQDIWPPAPVSDLVAAPGAEGQMLLQWTSPDSNDNQLPGSSTPAAGYALRVATFTVASVGGSTTTWWSMATDVRTLVPPAFPPVPGAAGSAESASEVSIEAISTGGFYGD